MPQPPSDVSAGLASSVATRPGKFLLPLWLVGYQKAWLGPDLLAGVTLAAYAIPVSLAYAMLAGLPPQRGLYCFLVGGVGYALFGSSRHLAVGTTSAISLIFGLTLARLAAGDSERMLTLVMLATWLVALIFFLAWLLRLSVVANFISDSVLLGFKAGAALAIAVTQVPKLLGVPGGGEDFFERVWCLGTQLGQTNPVVLGVGLAALALLLAGERWWPGRPAALVAVVLALIAVPLLDLARHGVQVVGVLPAGLPAIGGANLDFSELDTNTRRELAGLAFACFLLSYVESLSAARALALRHRYDIDARQELLGLGMANALAALFQGYPCAGGLSQSAVNEKAGARTPLALLFSSLTLGLVLLFLTRLFRNLPQAVLAAVVLAAVKSLIQVGEFRHLARVSRLDFIAALAGLGGVLVLGILNGVIFAVVTSLLLLLIRTSTPHVAFLGRIPGTNRFSDLARHPDNEAVPGALLFRVEAALLYFNVEHVHRTVLEQVQKAGPGLSWVICDLSNTPYLDVAGVHMLRRLCEELGLHQVGFRIVEAHATQRDLLRAEGLDHLVGPIRRGDGLADTLTQLGLLPTPATTAATACAPR